MKIECPKCFKENDLHLEAKVKCGHCQEELTGNTFKKPIMSGIAVLSIGIIGGQFVDYAVTDNRYPLKVEYAVLEACSSSYKEPLSYSTYGSKKKICLCALEDTMNEISYIRYKVDEDGFLKAFEANARSCSSSEKS